MTTLNLTTVFCSWLLALALIQPFYSAAGYPGKARCRNPIVRKEWRTLTSHEKLNYISALQCLQRLPAKTTPSTPGAVTRYDDFIGVHIKNAPNIHFVGHCHAWHRYFVALFEEALRVECGYSGAQPYWDWTQDAGCEADFLASPVFHPTLGFGGNGPYVANSTGRELPAPGRTGGGCVKDGPFKSLELHLGPKSNIERNNHCLTRDLSPWVATRFITTALAEDALSQANFGWFDKMAQGGIAFIDQYKYHAGGHLAVGGELGAASDFWASPSDPLFYLHHSNMDRLWWEWQTYDLPQRLKDISGPIHAYDFPFGNTTSRGNVTLSFNLLLNELAPTVPIADVMDIQGDTLCYDYI